MIRKMRKEKGGRGLCPCKELNLHCAEACKCSRSKCTDQAMINLYTIKTGNSSSDFCEISLMLFTKKVAATVVTQRRQENVIPDGADRFEADVEQSSTAIQVNLHKKIVSFSS